MLTFLLPCAFFIADIARLGKFPSRPGSARAVPAGLDGLDERPVAAPRAADGVAADALPRLLGD